MFSHDEINSLIKKIVQKYEPEKLIIFGSHANNTANKDSDLDILIIKNTNENFYKRSLTVRKLLRPNNIPTDIFVFTPEEFAEKKC